MNALTEQIQTIKSSFISALKNTDDPASLEQIRITYLGRQGLLAQLMTELKTLSGEERKIAGKLLNELKQMCMEAFAQKQQEIAYKNLEEKLQEQKWFDVTAYTPQQLHGSLHPMTYLVQEIENVFLSMGFHIADGPEAESEYYNFEALNIPSDHPARDMWDTFYIDIPNMVLRTHTSSVQIREMKKGNLPLALVAPGRCYRHEATDATHDFVFMQTEGLFIDKNVSLSNLLATVKTFLEGLFQHDISIRVRPSYFPFVEPGVEIDMTCPFCQKGCSACKKTQWIEICGAGLVHPNVLKACDIDPKEYSGFAFGFGITRLAMLKYGINDIRLLHSAKIDFLKQF